MAMSPAAGSPGSSVTGTVHALCDDYVNDYVRLDPIIGSYLGDTGSDELLTDYSPDAVTARAELGKRALRAVAAAEPADDAERIAKEVFTERLGLSAELFDAGEEFAALNVIESPVQHLRQVFDLMPVDTAEQWAVIARRLAALPDAVTNLCAGLDYGARQGRVAAVRQVTKVAAQCETWAGAGGTSFFRTFVAGMPDALGSPALRAELTAAADGAAAAYARLAAFLREDLAPRAPTDDAVGAERYRLWSRTFTGAQLDLAESYEWGWREFLRLEEELVEVASRVAGTPAQAAEALDNDPRYAVTGQENLQRWMQELSNGALKQLQDKHFAIPDELMSLECRIAPAGGVLGAYYTGPTDDFARPGRMWWSVPADQTHFPVWREATVVYHEGVPGHHLQVATAVYHRQRLNKFQRQLTFVSGHGEGWALYAERLMRELGYLTDDGSLMGMLISQMFRAGRVIVDIGMHLKLPIPEPLGFHPGQQWIPDLALEFMAARTQMPRDQVADEIDRYLGWPGQAPSYKLGERAWLAAREAARARGGDRFDIKEFHARALEIGPMGLDALTAELARI